MNTKKVSIKDIALKADVSIGTVDRVIHQRGEVSESTRERVRKVIEELKYQPNLIARSLASKKKLSIAILLPKSNKYDSYWYYPQVGIDKALNEIIDHRPVIHNFRYDLGNKQQFIALLKKLKQTAYDGLLTAPVYPVELAEFIRQIPSEKETILIDSNIQGVELDFIGQDVKQSGQVAGRLMQLLTGNKRNTQILIPEIVSNIQSIPLIKQRVKGFLTYLDSHFKEARVTQMTVTIAEGQKEIPELKNLDIAKFDGVFIPNSRSYLVAENTNRKGNMIGYDLTEKNIHLLKNGTLDFIISQQPERQGYMAMMRLFNKIIGKEKSISQFYLPIDVLMKENLEHYINKQLDFKSDIGY